MEELNLDNILGAEEIDNLFMDEEELQETPPDKKEKETEKETEEKTTEVVDVNDLFADEPEGVGSEEPEDNIEEKEDTRTKKGNGASPKNNFYSSIAKALKEEGIFPDLEDDVFSQIKQPEDFRDLIDK